MNILYSPAHLDGASVAWLRLRLPLQATDARFKAHIRLIHFSKTLDMQCTWTPCHILQNRCGRDDRIAREGGRLNN